MGDHDGRGVRWTSEERLSLPNEATRARILEPYVGSQDPHVVHHETTGFYVVSCFSGSLFQASVIDRKR